MILDHKKRFRESPANKPWHDATASDWFHAGLATAMLEVSKNLPAPQEMGAAAANAFRLQGAQLMLTTILNLTEPTTTPKPKVEQNLNFEA